MIVSIELIVLANIIGLFILILVGLIALLSILRQHRHLRLQRADMQRHHPLDLTVALSQLVPAGNTNAVVRQPRSVIAKHEAREAHKNRAALLPVPVADSQRNVIQLNPDRQTQNPPNVQRLIDYLKAEMERTHQAS